MRAQTSGDFDPDTYKQYGSQNIYLNPVVLHG